MLTNIIGRKIEQDILGRLLQMPEAELVAVTGRRRVGKTFLVTTAYRERIIFEFTGEQDGDINVQLQNFTDYLQQFSKSPFPIKYPETWSEAFRLLRDYLQHHLSEADKKVVFLDEFPWMASPKSGFLEAFAYFWNTWASRQNLVIVICGSAASWIIQKVVNDRGGLHNRITKRIHLEPFTLAETEAYLKARFVSFDRYQTVQLYMAMGGIPHYLKEIDPAKTAIQNIDAICFGKQGTLSDEFNRLYHSLFSNADTHILVIRTLSQKQQGMTRLELLDKSHLTDGGGLTKVLEELIQSGFVAEYFPFGKKKKEKLYRVCDEYSLFYLKFIEEHRYQGGNIWQHLSQKAGFKSWSGYAFEGICLKHIDRIKEALSIAGIFSRAASFYKKGIDTEEGVQIDMLLDRNDHTINLFEIKFYNTSFTLTKDYAERLRHKIGQFQHFTNTKKHVNWVFISTFGVSPNMHSMGLIVQSLTLDDLF